MLRCRWATEAVAAQDPERGAPQICAFRGQEPLVCCPTSADSVLFPNSGFFSLTTPLPLDAVGAVATTPRTPPVADGTPGSMARRMCVIYQQRYVPDVRYGPDKDCVPNHTYPIGGNPALRREFPHMALLGYGPRDKIEYYCGGTLVSLQWVMTAAHCVFAGDTNVPVSWVLVGELVRSRTDDDANPQLIAVVQRIRHPGYKWPQTYNDIALLRLQTIPDMSTGHVRPTCLHVDREFKKEKMYLTGWGITETGEPADALMEVALYRVPYEECAKSYDSSLAQPLPRGIDDDLQLCAGAKQLLKDACYGDSGGPIQTPVDKATCMHQQTGIVSAGQGCGQGAPGIYTRVSTYVPWIEAIIWPDPVQGGNIPNT